MHTLWLSSLGLSEIKKIKINTKEFHAKNTDPKNHENSLFQEDSRKQDLKAKNMNGNRLLQYAAGYFRSQEVGSLRHENVNFKLHMEEKDFNNRIGEQMRENRGATRN
jgi:hypothetical protein